MMLITHKKRTDTEQKMENLEPDINAFTEDRNLNL